MIELKLQLLHLAGGDTGRAQHLLDWVCPKPAEHWPRACWGRKPLAEVPNTATFRAEHGTLYACIDGEIWSVELPHETRARESAALSVPEVAEVEIPEGSAQQEKLSRLEDVRTAAKTLLANASGHYINAEDRYVLESALDMFEDSDVPEGYKPWPPQETLAHDAMIEYRWREGDFFRAAACQTIQWTEAPQFYRVLPIENAAEAKGEGEDPAMNVPEGFMVWSPVEPLINPRPADGDIVRCWFGGEDYVGPLRGDEFDWNCEADPILAYEIIKTFAQVEQEKAAPDTIAITIAASQPHAEESARAQSLPPLFPPEPPQPATPEELEKMGVTDPGASAMARMLLKERA